MLSKSTKVHAPPIFSLILIGVSLICLGNADAQNNTQGSKPSATSEISIGSDIDGDSASKPLDAAAARVFERLKPVVFQVKTAIQESASKASYGSAFVVDKKGLLVTNFHVVSDAVLEPEHYKLYLLDAGKPLLAKIKRVQVVHDLALIHVDREFADVIEFAPRPPRQGESIYSIGMPEDLNMAIVSGVFNGFINSGAYSKIHMSSPINSGQSGGPTVDARGRLVGVNVSKLVFSQNISFSVPKNLVEAMLEENRVAEKEEAAKASAGVKTESTSLPAKLFAQMKNQLAETQDKLLLDLQNAMSETRLFHGWNIPKLPDYLRCWSDAIADEKQRFNGASEKCYLNDYANINKELLAGYYEVSVWSLKRIKLNGVQFFHLLFKYFDQDSQDSSIVVKEEQIQDFTSYECADQDIRLPSQVPFRVSTCVRGLVRLTGLYDVQIKLSTLTKDDRALGMRVFVRGATKENIKKVTEKMLSQVSRP